MSTFIVTLCKDSLDDNSVLSVSVLEDASSLTEAIEEGERLAKDSAEHGFTATKAFISEVRRECRFRDGAKTESKGDLW